jgi:Flp pilus assembly protein TadG
MHMHHRLTNNERGAALLETAVTLPLILLVCISIFEFGRAYQTWQVLTNAAREGARVAVLDGATPEGIKAAVKKYAEVGGVTVTDAEINIAAAEPLGTWTGSQITVDHPFDFIVLNPIAKMVVKGSNTGKPLTMTAVALMRNEGS